jgi:DNA repair exonuclease SbcCD ATPase subunit
MWATIWETAKYLIPVLGAGGAWWVRDRRKDRAASDVAERTVGAEVAVKEAGADEARLVYVQRATDIERQFHRQAIQDRDDEIERQRAELHHRERIIDHLRIQVEELRQRLADTMRELDSVRDQLAELADHDQENP